MTAGAGFGGTLAILLVGGGTVVLGTAFGFGLASLLLVRFLASVRGRTSTLTFVLAGVVVSAFFESAISIIKLLADPHQKLPAITYWLMGSIAATSYQDLALLAVAIVPPAIVIFLLRYQINILSLGEDKARPGVSHQNRQWTIRRGPSSPPASSPPRASSAGSASSSPMWRALWSGPITSGCAGAADRGNLPLVDDIARTATVAELPIGIITALIGVPVFAVILRRIQSRSGWNHD